MPKIIIHAPKTTFDSKARQAIAAELTDFALDCEALPQSPFVKSTVWTSEGADLDHRTTIRFSRSRACL